MAVYREGYKIIEILHQKSKKMGDVRGMIATENDKVWNAVKTLVHLYNVDGTRKVYNKNGNKVVEIIIKLVDEWAVSDGIKSIPQATEYWKIEFTKDEFWRMDGTFKFWRADDEIKKKNWDLI